MPSKRPRAKQTKSNPQSHSVRSSLPVQRPGTSTQSIPISDNVASSSSAHALHASGLAPPTRVDNSLQDPSQLKLQQELAWCLERLEIQMQEKGTSRQAEEARKAWKILSSSSTPLVKKRQVMRNLFGDYRSKMEQEERQYSIRPQNMRFKQVGHSSQPRSKYFKLSSYCSSNVLDNTTKNFQFKFSLDDNEGSDVSDLPWSNGNGEDNSASPAVNYYHMETSRACNFNFNFDVDQS